MNRIMLCFGVVVIVLAFMGIASEDAVIKDDSFASIRDSGPDGGEVSNGQFESATRSNSWLLQALETQNNVGKWTSIVLDPKDRPHISYHDDTNADLKYTFFDGDQWNTDVVDETGNVGDYTSIALDSNNQPHISYYDESFDDLMYAHYNGTGWTNETLATNGNVGMYNSIAVDSNDRPHISYYDTGNLKYAYWNGTGWTIQQVDNAVWYTSLALDSNDRPHISYYEYTHDDLMYAHYNGAAWEITAVDEFGDVGKYTSIALDSDEYPHISYQDVSMENLKYAYYNGSDWKNETVDSSSRMGQYSSLELDSGDHPHISYLDTTNYDLRYAYHNGSAWEKEIVESSGNVGLYSSMALSSGDVPHISYYKSATLDLKYAVLDNNPPNSSVNSLTGYWKHDSVNITVNATDNGESGVDSVELFYRYREHEGLNWNGWNSSGVDTKGPWSWMFNFSAGEGHYEFYSNATDHAGRVETSPVSADAKCGYRPNRWSIMTLDTDGTTGKYTSMALDDRNLPHISYCDDTNDDLKYAHFNGTQWVIQSVDTTGLVGKFSSIAVDANKKVHISYFDDTNDDLKYAYLYNGSWYNETIDSNNFVGQYTSIALDSNNRPHISYYNATYADLDYIYHDGTKWNRETVDSTGTVGRYSSIALDSNDKPHICYQYSSSYDLKYAYKDGTWQRETVDSGGPSVGYDTSLVLDSNDRPHISHFDTTNDDLKYAHYDGSQWKIKVIDSVGNTGDDTSITLDGLDRPMISYFSNTDTDLKLAYLDEGVWHLETTDSNGNVGIYTSNAVDSDGRIHVSYHSSTGYDLKYAVLDYKPPRSRVEPITPYWSKTSPVTVNVKAADTSELLYFDDFESGMGNWSHVEGDDFNWSLNSGSTGSQNTGPSSGADGTTWYVYTEASSPNYPSKEAIIESPSINFGPGSGEIAFAYHMYGEQMGYLYLEANTTAQWSTIWSLNGNQGDKWHFTVVDLSSLSGTGKLRFRGMTGSSYTSDMSIDQISIYAGGALAPVKDVTLWYRHSTNNGSWGGWKYFGKDSGSPYSFNFNGPEGSGHYQFYSVSNDTAGNTEKIPGSEDAIWGYDKDAPVVSSPFIYNGNVHNKYFNGAVSIRSNASDADSGIDPGTAQYSLNNGLSWQTATWSGTYMYKDSLTPGQSIDIKFRIGDKVGNGPAASSTTSYTYDSTNPTLGNPEIYQGNYQGQYYKGTIGIRGTATDAGCGVDSSTAQYSLDNGNTWQTASWDGTYIYKTGLTPGQNIDIKFRVKDNLGNGYTSSSTKSCTYDSTNPSLGNPEIYQGSLHGQYYKGTIGIRATATDTGCGVNGSTAQYSLDGGTSWQSANWDGTYIYKAGLTPGQNINIKFRVKDNLGNGYTSSSTKSCTYDSTNPSLGNPEIYQGSLHGQYYKGTIGIRATATDTGCGVNGSTAQYSLDGGTSWQSANWDGTYIYKNGLTPGQNIDIKFRITDLLGNGPTGSSTKSYTHDPTNPTLGNPEIYQGNYEGQYYRGAIAIRATATDAGCGVNGSTAEYSLDGGTSWQTADWDGTYAFKEGLSPGAFISIQFKVKDNLDNGDAFSPGKNYNFDNTKPASSVEQLGAYWKINAPITIEATATDHGDVGVMEVALLYRHSHDNSTWGNVTLFDIDTKSPWAFNFSAPADWGFYRFFSVANDSLGNRENVPGQFDRECGYDYLMPYIDADNSPFQGTTGDIHNFQITAMDNIKVTGVTVTWSHGNHSGQDEKLDYLGDNNWTLKITLDHSIDDLNYSFKMMDPAGNEFESQGNAINVKDNDPPHDIIAQYIPATATTGDGLTFIVAAHDNIAIDSVFLIYSFDGVNYGPPEEMPFDMGHYILEVDMAADATVVYHSFNVTDTSGLWNDSVSGEKQVLDNDAPTLETDLSENRGTTGDNYTFRIRALDNIGVKSVRVNWAHGMFQEEIELYPERNEMWIGNITLDFHSAEYLSYTIYMEDEAGNSNESDPKTVTVLDNDRPNFLEELTSKEPKTGKLYNVSVRIEDNIGVDAVMLGYVINEGQEPMWLQMEHVINEKWRVTIEIPEDARFINYFFMANDSENNELNTFDIYGPIQRHVFDVIPPVVGIHDEIIVDQHQPAHFEAWNVSDNIGIENFTWTIFYDNQEINLHEPEADFTFGIVGIYNVTLTARDEADNEGWNTVSVRVRDITGPVAKAGEDEEINQGDALHLNGDGSHDNVGIVNYTWTFEYDGKPWSLYGVKFEFVFDIPGEYEIILTVRDGAGNEGTDNMTARVFDVSQPTASGMFNDKPIEREAEYAIIQGTLCVLNAGNSSDNVGIESVTWTIEIEEERTEFHDMRKEYTFERIGVYRVSLTVRDPSGNEDHITFHVNVKPADPDPPVAKIKIGGPHVVKDGVIETMKDTELFFSSGESMDNKGIVARDWSIDGPGGMEQFSGEELDYTFNELGTYTVTLTVYDEAGNSHSESVNVKAVEDEPERPTVGPITDKNGNPVADAAVTIVYEGKEYTVKTDDSGMAQFDIPEIPDGTKITAEKDGETIEWTQGGNQPAFKSQEDDGGLPMTIIIGIVAGLLLAIILILIIVRRRKKEDEEEKKKGPGKEKEEEEKKKERDEEEEEEQEEEAGETEAAKKKPPAKKAKTPAKKPKAVTAAPAKGRKGKPKKKPKEKPGRKKKAAAKIKEYEEELEDEEFEEYDEEEFEDEDYEVEGEEDIDGDVEEWDFEDITEEEMEELPLPPPPEDLKEHFSGLELERVSSAIKNIIPGYIITDKLGAGGFATVYKAINKDGVAVALKLPKFLDETIDSSVLNKFQAEADIWKKLIHKNIVSFLDSNIRPVPYMAIELMEGGNLGGLLKDHNLSPREAKPLMLQIVDGLSYAHRMASVHRDIKPENILFTKDGVPKIADWGIGKFMASESVSQSIGTKGTFAYAAPEQFDRETYGQVDWSTDIFQMGIVFYEMITGVNPFMADELARVMGLILTRTPKKPSEINPEVTPELDEIVMKCLEKKKDDRWRSSDVLYTTLRDMEKRKLASLKKYRKTLERAMKDGSITEDEEEMLSEFREHFGITEREHGELLTEMENG